MFTTQFKNYLKEKIMKRNERVAVKVWLGDSRVRVLGIIPVPFIRHHRTETFYGARAEKEATSFLKGLFRK